MGMRLAFVLACVAFVSVSSSPAYFLNADDVTTTEGPKSTTTEGPKPTTTEGTKPTTTEAPKPTTTGEPKPTSEEPKPTSTGEPKPTSEEPKTTSGTNHLNMSYGLLLSMSSLVFFYIF